MAEVIIRTIWRLPVFTATGVSPTIGPLLTQEPGFAFRCLIPAEMHGLITFFGHRTLFRFLDRRRLAALQLICYK